MAGLREAFDAAVAANRRVTDVDGALVAAGRKLADQIDHVTVNGEGQEVTKALYLMPHLVNILREMLATPASRTAAKVKGEEQAGGNLARLRAVHVGKAG